MTSPAELAALDKDKGRKAALKDAAMVGDSGYDRIEADHYNTPPENLDCLVQHVALPDYVWEPAVGIGNLATRMHELGHTVWTSDIIDYGYDERFTLSDFFAQTKLPVPAIKAIVSNPPYETIKLTDPEWEHLAPLAEKYGVPGKSVSLAELFCRHAIALTQENKGMVAMFLRNEFDCSKGRMDLFSLPPFHKKIVVTKRPRWVADSTGSPRHNYSWFVWDWRHVKGAGAIAYSHPSLAKIKD
ncbi:hypothetical protein [Erythrobacter phage vB_EliS-L02]|nr:hypothetical protein [Erythrobacter phage vB_EliS-L02]